MLSAQHKASKTIENTQIDTYPRLSNDEINACYGKQTSSNDNSNLENLDSKKYKNFSGITHKLRDFNSLSDDEKSEGYIFHILTDSLSNDIQDRLKKFEKSINEIYPCKIMLHFIDKSIFENAPTWAGNHVAYYRLILPKLLESSVKYALYLDTDMLVMCDIRELFSIELGTHFAGVIKDFARENILKLKDSINSNMTQNKPLKNIIFDSNYFNSGFLLLNMPAIREIPFFTQMDRILFYYEPAFADQCVFNAIFKDNVLFLSFAYNCMVSAFGSHPINFCADECYKYDMGYTREQINVALHAPKIYHYTMPKPWYDIYRQHDYWLRFGVYVRRNMLKSLLEMWWDNALDTPIFSSDIRRIRDEIYDSNLDFSTLTQDKFDRLNSILDSKANILTLKSKLKKRDRIYISLFSIIFIVFIFDIFLRN